MIQKLFPAFGTVNSISVWDDSDPSIVEHVKHHMIQLHNCFSFFHPESEISQINRQAGIRPVTVGEDTFRLLSLALKYAGETDGTFDVTAGALSELWRNAIRAATLPSEAEADRCLALGKKGRLVLDHTHKTAFLSQKGKKLDLGGIAKGYAVEKARSLLLAAGVRNARINFGGTVAVMGNAQKIGLQNPFQKTGVPMADMMVENKGIVTSGLYERCFFHQGKRFHHIIDPRTGKPACSGLLSVSLIGEDAAALDALATGICCLGREAGMAIVRRHHLSAVFVTDDGCVQITPELQGNLSFSP